MSLESNSDLQNLQVASENRRPFMYSRSRSIFYDHVIFFMITSFYLLAISCTRSMCCFMALSVDTSTRQTSSVSSSSIFLWFGWSQFLGNLQTNLSPCTSLMWYLKLVVLAKYLPHSLHLQLTNTSYYNRTRHQIYEHVILCTIKYLLIWGDTQVLASVMFPESRRG
jgi:hypothetical protein